MTAISSDLRPLVERAVGLIPDNAIVGLGTGHAAGAFLHALAERVRGGLRIRGVPTSLESADLARALGIPLVTLDDVERIDIDVDGADEVDPHGNLIKGYGGALLREKIIAAASRRVVILVGREKLVPVLGSRGKLPIEVIPFALGFCRRRLQAIGFPAEPRTKHGQLFVTDNGNYILDSAIPALDQPAKTETEIKEIPGVVGTGLFLGMAHQVLIQTGDAVEMRTYAIGSSA